MSEFFQRRGLWGWGAGVVVFLALGVGAFFVDGLVREAVVAGQGKEWKRGPEARFHGMVRRVGDWPWLMVAGSVGLGVAWRLGRRRAMRVIAAAMVASTLAGIMANSLRLTTGRTRPRAPERIEQGFYGPWHEGRWLIGNSTFNSFPSGHAATAFGFAFPFVLASPLGGLPVLVMAIVVAWSSMALGAHHLSDIIFSLGIAFAVAWAVRRFMEGRGGEWLDRWLPSSKHQ